MRLRHPPPAAAGGFRPGAGRSFVEHLWIRDGTDQRPGVGVHLGEGIAVLVDNPEVRPCHHQCLRIIEEVRPLVLHIIHVTVAGDGVI